MINTQQNENLTPAKTPCVSVCCLTYNHEKTVAQALESMLSQKTDFPFEIIVHDDASTDGTQDIIRDYAQRYPEIIRPVLQSENKMKSVNIEKEYICPLIRGKFVAVCEGDDFWSDPSKLSLQVGYMEKNLDCAMTFHAVNQLNPDGSSMPYRPLKEDTDVPCGLIIKRGGMFCPSASLVIRAEIFTEWPEFRSMADVYDYPRQILSSFRGRVHYFDRIMACYRFGSSGSWTDSVKEKTDFNHVRNETAWLNEFNRYSDGKYENEINYHFAHLWFTEYRKNLDKSSADMARKYIKTLSFKQGAVFRVFLLLFSVFGKRANKIWDLMKKTLLK